MFSNFRLTITLVLFIFCVAVYPAIRMAYATDQGSLLVAQQSTREFVEKVKSKGYMDVADYEIYQKNLTATGILFEVTMEYQKKKYQPNYDNPNDFYTFKDTYEVLYEGYFNDSILDKLYPPGASLGKDDPSRRFNMRVGDFFKVHIESLDADLTSQVQSFFIATAKKTASYSFGGMVLNEAP